MLTELLHECTFFRWYPRRDSDAAYRPFTVGANPVDWIVNPYYTCQGFNRGGPMPIPDDSVFVMVVTRIHTLSPAGLAGLRAGDQIVAINSTRNTNQPNSPIRVKLAPDGSNVVTILRMGSERDIMFVIGE